MRVELHPHRGRVDGRAPQFRVYLIGDTERMSFITGPYGKVHDAGQQLARVLGVPLINTLPPERAELELAREAERQPTRPRAGVRPSVRVFERSAHAR